MVKHWVKGLKSLFSCDFFSVSNKSLTDTRHQSQIDTLVLSCPIGPTCLVLVTEIELPLILHYPWLLFRNKLCIVLNPHSTYFLLDTVNSFNQRPRLSVLLYLLWWRIAGCLVGWSYFEFGEEGVYRSTKRRRRRPVKTFESEQEGKYKNKLLELRQLNLSLLVIVLSDKGKGSL